MCTTSSTCSTQPGSRRLDSRRRRWLNVLGGLVRRVGSNVRWVVGAGPLVHCRPAWHGAPAGAGGHGDHTQTTAPPRHRTDRHRPHFDKGRSTSASRISPSTELNLHFPQRARHEVGRPSVRQGLDGPDRRVAHAPAGTEIRVPPPIPMGRCAPSVSRQWTQLADSTTMRPSLCRAARNRLSCISTTAARIRANRTAPERVGPASGRPTMFRYSRSTDDADITWTQNAAPASARARGKGPARWVRAGSCVSLAAPRPHTAGRDAGPAYSDPMKTVRWPAGADDADRTRARCATGL